MNGADHEVVIDVWLHNYPNPKYLDAINKLARDFERKHPGYRVNIEGHFFLAAPEDVRQAGREGRAPTIAEYSCLTIREALDNQGPDGGPLFTSVQQAIGGRTEILGEPVNLDDIVPAARDSFDYGGELVSLPWRVSTPLLYANRTMLRNAGVTTLPRTWADLEHACRAVMALPGGPPHGVTWANFGWFFLHALAQQGAQLADHDNGRSGRAERVDLGSATMMEFVRWWYRLYQDGCYYYSGTPAKLGSSDAAKAFGDSFAAFAEQRVAFVLGSSVDVSAIVESAEAGGFELATCRVPCRDLAGYAGNMIGGYSLWLTDVPDAKVRDGALAFMLFLNNPRNAAAQHTDTMFSPVTSAAGKLLAGEGWYADHPYLRQSSDIVADAIDSPAARGAVVGVLSAIQNTLADAMHDVLTDAADPDRRFAAATDEACKLVDDYERSVL